MITSFSALLVSVKCKFWGIRKSGRLSYLIFYLIFATHKNMHQLIFGLLFLLRKYEMSLLLPFECPMMNRNLKNVKMWQECTFFLRKLWLLHSKIGRARQRALSCSSTDLKTTRLSRPVKKPYGCLCRRCDYQTTWSPKYSHGRRWSPSADSGACPGGGMPSSPAPRCRPTFCRGWQAVVSSPP